MENLLALLHLNIGVFPAFHQPTQLHIDRKLTQMMIIKIIQLGELFLLRVLQKVIKQYYMDVLKDAKCVSQAMSLSLLDHLLSILWQAVYLFV